MGFITDNIKRQVDAFRVARDLGVQLKPSGAGRFVGCCPFHDDAKPSFELMTSIGDSAFFQCWSGCEKTWDVIEFVRDRQGSDFIAACKWLVDKYGLVGCEEEPPRGGGDGGAGAGAKRAEAVKKNAGGESFWRSIWRVRLIKEAFNHPTARAYYAGRGIPLDFMPGGTLPRTLLFSGVYRGVHEGDPQDMLGHEVPSIVAPFSAPAAENIEQLAASGVHVTHLEDDGQGGVVKFGGSKKLKSKIKHGKFGTGGAFRMVPPDAQGGLLIVCEGIETGMAVLAAVRCAMGLTPEQAGPAVWPCLDTGGIKNFKVQGPDRRWVKRIIIAADRDSQKMVDSKIAGENAAHAAASRLAIEGTPDVAIAMPGQAYSEQLDWLDVVEEAWKSNEEVRVSMLARIGQEILGAERFIMPTGQAERIEGVDEDDDEPLIGDQASERAMAILTGCFTPAERKGSVFLLRRWGEKWYTYSALERRWRERSHEEIRAIARWRLEQFYRIRARDKKRERFTPSTANVDEALQQAIGYISCSCKAAPVLLPPNFAANTGMPLWRSTLGFEQMEQGDDAKWLLTAANGVLDMAAWRRTRVPALRPHTPRWFNLACLPYALDVDALARFTENHEAIDGMDEWSWSKKGCPTWMKFMQQSVGHLALQQWTIEEFIGYCMTRDQSFHKLLMLVGEPGSGKSLTMGVAEALVGKKDTCSVDVAMLATHFGMAPMENANLYLMDEPRTGFNTDVATLLNRIYKISTGQPVAIENKHKTVTTDDRNVVLPGKFIIGCNQLFAPKGDSAAALVRRLLVVQFGKAPETPNRMLKEELLAELPQIAVRCLVAWFAMMGLGKFTESASAQDIKNEIQAEMSVVGEFVKECVLVVGGEEGAEVSVTKADMFKAFRAWFAERNGYDYKGSLGTFTTDLRAVNSTIKATISGAADPASGQRVRIYRHVDLHGWARDKYVTKQVVAGHGGDPGPLY